MARPEKPIDWALVDNLLVAGCHGTEIAAHFDIHYNTFYLRIEEKYGKSFSEYRDEKRQKGLSILRAKQFEKAAKGDNSMLIWLGKNLLKQTDSDKSDGNTINLTELKKLIDKISIAQPDEPLK